MCTIRLNQIRTVYRRNEKAVETILALIYVFLAYQHQCFCYVPFLFVHFIDAHVNVLTCIIILFSSYIFTKAHFALRCHRA